MTKLSEITTLMRSKNAGPFELTIDLMFADPASYHRVVDAAVVQPGAIAGLLGVEQQLVRVFNYEPALAIKITVPRPVSVGDPMDADLFGGQLFGPLIDLDVP